MAIFIFKRIIQGLITLIGLSFLSFLLVKALPGDPLEIRAGERSLNIEQRTELEALYGFDKPFIIQYFRYAKGLLHGDFGVSFKSYEPVSKEFFERFPATIELAISSILLAILFGMPLGIWAAIRHNKLTDQAITGFSLTGYSLPIFWWGLMLILLFSNFLDLTPVDGRLNTTRYWVKNSTGFILIDSLLSGEKGAFLNALHHFILPTIVLATIPFAIITRMTRSALLEVLDEDYITTAKAKGLSSWRILIIHALRNALIPIITIIGLQVSMLISGAVLTETIFAWPGIGKWIYDAFNRRDYPVIQGGILLVAILIIIINIIVDLLYAWANPLIRKKGSL